MNKNFEEKIKEMRIEIINNIINKLCNSEREVCELNNVAITSQFNHLGGFPPIYVKVVRLHKGELVADVVYDLDGEVSSISQSEFENLMTDSLIDIHKKVVQTIDHRLQRLEELYTLVRNVGGKINFDGKFGFCGSDYNPSVGIKFKFEKTSLMGLSLNDDGKLIIDVIWNGAKYVRSESFIPDTEIDRITDYVKSQCKKTYTIRVVASRMYEIKGTSYEDALAKAKREIERNPLSCGDVDEWERLE